MIGLPIATWFFAGRFPDRLTEAEQRGRRHAKRMRQYANVDERDVAFAPFDLAQIRAGESAFEGKVLRRPAAFLT